MSGTNLYTGGTVDVSLTDEFGNAVSAKCLAADIPSGAAGYAVGCELFAEDTGAHYYNTGSATSCTFTLAADTPAGSVTATELASNAVTTAKILDANVTLAKLASGITPSHVVKYAGEVTWSGSGASLATTVTGVAATDIVMATIASAPTQAAYLVSAATTLNTLTFVLSAANTSNDAVIAYTVYRAAA